LIPKIFLVLFLLQLQSPAAAAILMIDPKADEYDLSPFLEYLEDKSGSLTIDDVARGGFRAAFRHHSGDTLNFGFTSSKYWVRTVILPDKGAEDWLIVVGYSLLNNIGIYLPGPDGGYTVTEMGNTLPFYNRPVVHRYFAVPVTLTPGRNNAIFFEFSSQSSMQMPMTLIKPMAFAQKVQEEYIANGIFYGITFVMIIYNLFLFFAVRDRSYFLYVCYVLCFTFWQASLDGFGYQFLWPGSTTIASKAVPLFPVLVSIWAYLFTRDFLRTARHLPEYDRFLKFFLAALVIMAPLSLVLSYRIAIQISAVIAVVGSVFLLGAGYLSMMKGNRPAVFYVIAWTLFLVGNIVLSLSKFGLLPRVFITEHASQLGSVMEVILLSLALGDRINIERQEKYRLREELQVAQNIQKSILPDILPDSPFFNIAARYVPMESVGGDFYDFHIIGDRKMGVLVTDVSGHGIPAAIIASMVKIAFSIQKNLAHDPAAFIRGLNEILMGNLEKQFLTAGYVFIDMECGTLSYARGGHVPLLVYKKNQDRLIECIPKGPLLGFSKGLEYRCESMRIEEGDRVILYTDGIIEAFNDRHEMFSEKKLFDLIQKKKDLSPRKFIDSLLAALRIWTGKIDSFDDDLTIVVIDIKPGTAHT